MHVVAYTHAPARTHSTTGAAKERTRHTLAYAHVDWTKCRSMMCWRCIESTGEGRPASELGVPRRAVPTAEWVLVRALILLHVHLRWRSSACMHACLRGEIWQVCMPRDACPPLHMRLVHTPTMYSQAAEAAFVGRPSLVLFTAFSGSSNTLASQTAASLTILQ